MFRKFFLTIIFSMMLSSPVSAYDAVEVSNAIGMYLGAADLQQKLSNSQCSYVSKKTPPRLEDRLREVLSYLTPSDKAELENYVRSADFKNKMAKHKIIINDMYDAYLKEGIDKRTACGLLWGSLSQMISKGELAWKNVEKNH